MFESLTDTASQCSTLPNGVNSGSISSKRACIGMPLNTIFVDVVLTKKCEKLKLIKQFDNCLKFSIIINDWSRNLKRMNSASG